MTSIYGLITIVDRSKSAAVLKIYREQSVPVSLVVRGHGTANNEIMDMLGLDEPQKDLVFSFADSAACRGVFSALDERMHISRPGTGIAFTFALSSISLAASGAVAGAARPDQAIKEGQHMEQQAIEMIVTVVDSGSTDVVVHAAKAAGAHGGTVVKAREIASDEQKKIFGITVQPEKEVVLMLVPVGNKNAIFKAICSAVLEQTGEHAFAFSLPVSETAGLKR